MDKFDELKSEAREDLAIVRLENLDQESYKNQNIKPKWLEYKSRFELLKTQAHIKYTKLYREKWEYYGGKSDAKVYAAKPFDIKVLKNDLQMYINADDDIIELQAKIAYYEVIIKYIDGIINSIDKRGWDIRNAQDWKKFEAGML
jgi:hypothetical protein|tara:strand:- start:2750 stop:3184 length:435 start_codon:yes stop_codon:yes gene_type:complete